MVATAPAQFPGGTAAQARRRRQNRPPTVPLDQFGKEPPPPPRLKMDRRTIARFAAISAVLLVLLTVGVLKISEASERFWSTTKYLDQRVTR